MEDFFTLIFFDFFHKFVNSRKKPIWDKGLLKK